MRTLTKLNDRREKREGRKGEFLFSKAMGSSMVGVKASGALASVFEKSATERKQNLLKCKSTIQIASLEHEIE